METMKLDSRVRACVGIAEMRMFVGRITQGRDGICICCEPTEKRPEIAFSEADTAEELLERFVGMRHMLLLESMKYCDDYSRAKDNHFLSQCIDCPQFRTNYSKGYWTFETQVTQVDLNFYPSPCNAHCIYCTAAGDTHWENSDRVAKVYRQCFDFLQLADEAGIFAPDCRWNVLPGEIAIHPYREQILELVKGKRARFFTNYMVFVEGIAEHLHDVPGTSVEFSIDAGSRESWRKIKGRDNFEHAVDHFKRYCQSACDLDSFELKYIIIPGVNDSDEDFHFVMELMQDSGLKTLTISRDVRAKDEQNDTLLEKMVSLSILCHKNGIRPRYRQVDFTTGYREKIESLIAEQGY